MGGAIGLGVVLGMCYLWRVKFTRDCFVGFCAGSCYELTFNWPRPNEVHQTSFDFPADGKVSRMLRRYIS